MNYFFLQLILIVQEVASENSGRKMDLLIVNNRLLIKFYIRTFVIFFIIKYYRIKNSDNFAMNFIFLLSVIFSTILASEMSDRIYKVLLIVTKSWSMLYGLYYIDYIIWPI